MMTCSHGAFSFEKPEDDLEYEPKQALFSKGKLSLDDELEKFHPISPGKNIRRISQ